MIRANLGHDLEAIEEELNAWVIEEQNTTLQEPMAMSPAPQQPLPLQNSPSPAPQQPVPLQNQPAPPSASDEQVPYPYIYDNFVILFHNRKIMKFSNFRIRCSFRTYVTLRKD
jgi:hypothetical protein